MRVTASRVCTCVHGSCSTSTKHTSQGGGLACLHACCCSVAWMCLTLGAAPCAVLLQNQHPLQLATHAGEIHQPHTPTLSQACVRLLEPQHPTKGTGPAIIWHCCFDSTQHVCWLKPSAEEQRALQEVSDPASAQQRGSVCLMCTP